MSALDALRAESRAISALLKAARYTPGERRTHRDGSVWEGRLNGPAVMVTPPPRKGRKAAGPRPIAAGWSEEITPHPALGMYGAVLTVDEIEGDHAHVRLGHTRMKVPAATVPVIGSDLRGEIRGPRSRDRQVNAVLSGRGALLGKGDDGLAFRVGDDIVKVSTVVPYQPMNGFAYRAPAAALAQAREQHETVEAMRADGVPGLLPERFVEHAGRGFTIKPYVEIPKKLTERQTRDAQNIVKAMHDRGWVLDDAVQVGIHKGAVVLYDAGKARKPPADDAYGLKYAKEGDEDRLQSLFHNHGHRYVPGGGDAPDRWRHAVATAEDSILAWGGPRRIEEHAKLLHHIADEMRAAGTPVDAELRHALDAMERERAALEAKRQARKAGP